MRFGKICYNKVLIVLFKLSYYNEKSTYMKLMEIKMKKIYKNIMKAIDIAQKLNIHLKKFVLV